MPAIPTTGKVDMGGFQVQGQPGQFSRTPTQKREKAVEREFRRNKPWLLTIINSPGPFSICSLQNTVTNIGKRIFLSSLFLFVLYFSIFYFFLFNSSYFYSKQYRE
jgi:hypothetical protein